MFKVLALIGLVLVALYWSNTQKLKSLALAAARKRCREAGVQLLDHTVVQNKLYFGRDTLGHWRTIRHYQFDFTSTGEHRYQGMITVFGNQVTSVELEAFPIN